ncbi:MAG TPA: L,D-transpeptidase family protein [Caulobacteraceae bacterium]|jgi:L,D-peptidoglycan transpeptidase YkuD (ErfK/YbiS/YcfS/YnhG family)|nr:L,D-transpeptidase family protein [Caulobacteraceae bacterium]
MPAPPLSIEVRAQSGATMGTLLAADARYRCALGKAGIVMLKREGDGGTPHGRFPLREVFYRPDRIARPATGLPVAAIGPQDGWCDDPASPRYNQQVRLPFAASHEELWRQDGLYDLIAVIGFNDDPPVPGAGSAIFMHVARREGEGYGSTAGCVALELPDLIAVLRLCGPGTTIRTTLA